MSVRRSDGSVYSENTPSLDFSKGQRVFGTFRVILTSIKYVDDKKNIYGKTQAPEVVYDGVIVGGPEEGQQISNIKDATNGTGGDKNYGERIFRVCSNPLTGPKAVPLSKQDGDLVYVNFVNGNTAYPIIIGGGKSPKDFKTTGAKKADGPRVIEEYNGIFQQINKDGEYTLLRKGGTFDPIKGVFKPGEEKSSMVFLDKKGSILVLSNDGSLLSLNAEKGEVSIIQKDGHTFAMTQDELSLMHKNGQTILKLGSDAVQLTSEKDLILQGNQITQESGAGTYTAQGDMIVKGGTLTLNGGMKVNSLGQVGIGNSFGELFDLLDQLLTALQTETHIGNLGFPTSPPVNAPVYLAIQIIINLIKGSL